MLQILQEKKVRVFNTSIKICFRSKYVNMLHIVGINYSYESDKWSKVIFDRMTISNIDSNANDNSNLNSIGEDQNVQGTENDAKSSFEKCTAATSTEELLSYSCVEVQTITPYDTPESESETNDEPIENLSVSINRISSLVK